jgi:integrase
VRPGPRYRGTGHEAILVCPSSSQAPNPGLHFHDLRHTGNHFAAASGASLKDLMARMGHDSERAAIIYQHEAQGADLAITSAIDAYIEAANTTSAKGGDSLPDIRLMAR